jgi:hypothetical protein
MPKLSELDLTNKQMILIEMIFEYIEKIHELLKNFDEKKDAKIISI